MGPTSSNQVAIMPASGNVYTFLMHRINLPLEPLSGFLPFFGGIIGQCYAKLLESMQKKF